MVPRRRLTGRRGGSPPGDAVALHLEIGQAGIRIYLGEIAHRSVATEAAQGYRRPQRPGSQGHEHGIHRWRKRPDEFPDCPTQPTHDPYIG